MFYSLACFAVRLVLAIGTRCRVEGAQNLPRSGAFLLVSNHLNLADPPILGALLPRRITFMAKEELFNVPVVGWVVKTYGAFPVKRGQPDRQALKSALRVLERGGVVGMFPEGTRSKTGRINQAYPGAALVAIMGSAVVIPIAITGTDRLRSPFSLLRRPRITVRVGDAFSLDRDRAGKGSLDTSTRAMMSRIAVLLPEERRGFYADAVSDNAEG